MLEDEGVAGDVNVAQYKLEFLPVEEDLLSLELDDVARDIYLVRLTQVAPLTVERGRHANIVLFAGAHDLSTGFWLDTADSGQG